MTVQSIIGVDTNLYPIVRNMEDEIWIYEGQSWSVIDPNVELGEEHEEEVSEEEEAQGSIEILDKYGKIVTFHNPLS